MTSAAFRSRIFSSTRGKVAAEVAKRVVTAQSTAPPRHQHRAALRCCWGSFRETHANSGSTAGAATAVGLKRGHGSSEDRRQGVVALVAAGSALAWCVASSDGGLESSGGGPRNCASCSAPSVARGEATGTIGNIASGTSSYESPTPGVGGAESSPGSDEAASAGEVRTPATIRANQQQQYGKVSPVALSLASEYNANGPIEDRHDVRESPRGDFFASVYDGHGGWQCAEFARKRLNIAAQIELNNSLAKSPEQVKGALTHAFLRVEREYLYQVKAAFELGFGAVAKTGSCALMALVRDHKLYVANAGDCRAVLGRRRRVSALGGWGSGGGGDGVMEAVALSNDHNAREKVEQEKLKRLHPSEDDIVKCKRSNACYVKGRLQPTRSLGDAYLKYSEFNGQAGVHSSGGRFLPPPYTPPYITAEPEIHVHDIDPTQDEFVVLASDGLWDYISSTEAVEIVQTAAYQDDTPSSAGDRLIEVVLERAAARYNLSVEALKDVREGSSRRCKHDDITCVVFFLDGNDKNEGFGSLRAANGGGGGGSSNHQRPAAVPVPQ